LRLATPTWEKEFNWIKRGEEAREGVAVCLIWEGTKDGTFLRAVDTDPKRVKDHLAVFENERHNPVIRVEVNLTNHLFGQSMYMKHKNVNLPDA